MILLFHRARERPLLNTMSDFGSQLQEIHGLAVENPGKNSNGDLKSRRSEL